MSTKEGAALSELEVLVELQELDTRLSQLSHRYTTLPEKQQIAELQNEDRQLGDQLATIRGELEVLEQSQADREREVQDLEDKIAKSTSALYGGEMTSPKEATALQSEIDSISRRQAVLEDQIIELMEQIEPFAAEETRIATQRNAGEAALQKLEENLATTQAEIEDERRAVNEERAQLEERAGTDLVGLYNQNRTRMGDHTAVGRLVGTSCGACFLEISAVEIDRIRRLPNNEPSECPECGALLVR